MLDLNGEISAIVESAELRRSDLLASDGASSGSLGLRSSDSLVQGGGVSTVTLTASLECNFSGGNGLLLSSEGSGREDIGGLLGHMGSGEVTEGRVLGLGQELVVRWLERLGSGSVKNVLQVILEDHAGSEGGQDRKSVV